MGELILTLLKHMAIVICAFTVYFMIGAVYCGFRRKLLDTAKTNGAKRTNPWACVITEGLLVTFLLRTYPLKWLIDGVPATEGFFCGGLFTVIVIALMAADAVAFVVRRLQNGISDLVMSLFRIPLDLVGLAFLFATNEVSWLPAEMPDMSKRPLANPPETYVDAKSVGMQVRPSVIPAAPTATSPEGYDYSGTVYAETPGTSYADSAGADPVYIPVNNREENFVPDGDPYYTAKTTDGQTVYYKDADYRPFVDGGLDDVTRHDG